MTDQEAQALAAQWVLGIWLQTYDMWASCSKRSLRYAAQYARCRGLIVHDRVLAGKEP